jgi:2-amino-4-hydroxy-6-hydroxymethyldihydropteridine diphosphokinase
LHEIERRHGRTRVERWGPRPLDLDLLLFGDSVIDEPGLTVPHPRMWERPFVMIPLAEVCEDCEGLAERLAAVRPHDASEPRP